ncbi:MAG: hypothetical protein Q8N96_10970 [Methylovulum sp.]|nr:hypothetical protein [Methylovulum sp.]
MGVTTPLPVIPFVVDALSGACVLKIDLAAWRFQDDGPIRLILRQLSDVLDGAIAEIEEYAAENPNDPIIEYERDGITSTDLSHKIEPVVFLTYQAKTD